MALADITPKLTVELDLTQATPRFTFKDETNYAAASVTFSNVVGVLSINVNGSSIYSNTNFASPDFDGNDSGQADTDITRFRTKGTYISAPLTGTALTTGTYNVIYTIYDSVLDETVVSEFSLNITYVKKTLVIEKTLNLNPFNVSLTGTDDTDYGISSITPTITRDFNLYFPQGSNATAINSTSSPITTTNVYTGIQTFQLTSDVSYNFASKTITGTTNSYASGNLVFNIVDQLTALSYQEVFDQDGICSVYCCVKDLNTRIENAKGNSTRYNELNRISGLVAMKMELLRSAYDCNDTDSTVINAIVNQIKNLCDCSGDCGCDDTDVPRLITSLSTGVSPVNNFLVYSATALQESLAVTSLIGKTYTSASGATSTNLATPIRRDFIVRVEGAMRNINFTSASGLIEFLDFASGSTDQLSAGAEITVQILR
jgi:hypothetical protein